MGKKIVFVGRSIVESEEVLNLAFDSGRTLLDGDIIIFTLDLSSYWSETTYQGLRCLDDHQSFKLKSVSEHWAAELKAALVDGKTVIVFLTNVEQLQIATGERSYSGTGRNRVTTRIVAKFDPYNALPVQFGSVIRKAGESIKTVSDLAVLSTYWHEFGPFTEYQAYIDGFKGTSLLKTKTGDKTVGGIVQFSNLKGTLVLLPPPDLEAAARDRAKHMREDQRTKTKAPAGSPAAKKQADSIRRRAEASVIKQFIASLVALDKAVRAKSDTTPPPTWSDQPRFQLANESPIQSAIEENAKKIAKLEEERSRLKLELNKARQLRTLLYEKGRPLESGVLSALKLLGYHAENLKEGDSEFDVVMTDPEGTRFIGEAEGKDDKSINVDKLDQLDRNLREDFARQNDEGAVFAKGVLFGNAQRLIVPEERTEWFTPKCQIAAKRSHIALVRTVDLFEVAQYLERNPDPDFAIKCRGAIRNADGVIVTFPEVPSS